MNATYTIRVFIKDRFEFAGKNVSHTKAKQIVEDYKRCGYYVQTWENVNGMTHLVRL